MELYPNPVINSDFPDPDIIRVGDTYYMATTTMFLMPGGDILCSRDLVHWTFVGHAFSMLEDKPAHRLENGQQIFGQGMWAPSLRWHDGTFYLTFSCNDTRKSILFQSEDPTGPWRRTEMAGFFYDSSLFFDDDGRIYIVHGNTTLRLTELDAGTWGPKEGGLDRVVAQDKPNQRLGFEGSHLYKRNGKYYLFTCHMPSEGTDLKTEVCFQADSLTGAFRGKTVLDDTMGYDRRLGVAQGGMVDTPTGDWYAFMFHDRGALGRTPVIMPMSFDEEGWPILGDNGMVPQFVQPATAGADISNSPLNGSDDFRYIPGADGRVTLALFWQFSHNPDDACWSVTERPGAFRLTARDISPNLLLARNILTQRCTGPKCTAWVTVDGSRLNEGDYAGICTYQGCYGAVALTKREGQYELVMMARPAKDAGIEGDRDYGQPPVEYTRIPAPGAVVTLRADTDFSREPDTAWFSFLDAGGTWKQLGVRHDLYFKLDLFIGCRFGLFCYATRQPGGKADCSWKVQWYEVKREIRKNSEEKE